MVTLTQSGISNSGTSLSFGSQNNSGSNITIPIMANDFSDITGFQFTIAYDATKLTNNSCSNWKGETNAGGVQITSLASNGKITFVVYPNPAENYLKIENAMDSHISIFDINGRKLMSTF